MIIRELGKVKQIIEEGCGLDICHFYDDIVLVEHSPFLIRFDNTDSRYFHLYFNRDCSRENREKLFRKLQRASAANGMRCTDSGSFSQEQMPDQEEIEISFYERGMQ
jgi:hypothetical protein